MGKHIEKWRKKEAFLAKNPEEKIPMQLGKKNMNDSLREYILKDLNV